MWLTPLKYRKPGTLVNDHLYKFRSLYIYSTYFDLVFCCIKNSTDLRYRLIQLS